MARHKKNLIISALFCVIIFAVSACANVEATTAPPELLFPEASYIHADTAVVTRGDVGDVERHTGIVRVDSMPVNFGSTAAQFGNFYVRHGDIVTEGQLLARLNFEQMERRVLAQEERMAFMLRDHALENEIRAVELTIRVAENNRAMWQAAESFDNDRMSAEEAESREIERAWYNLQLSRERQSLLMRHEEVYLNSLLSRLDGSELRAPFDGVITYISSHVHGSWVVPFANIVHIAPNDADVFVEHIGATTLLPAGMARIQAYIDGNAFDLTRLHLTRVQSLRYTQPPIRFTLDTDTPPPVGTLVSIHAYRRLVSGALRIPRGALLHDSGVGFYVHKAENGGMVQTLVSVGLRTATYVEILGGLAEGDIVHVR